MLQTLADWTRHLRAVAGAAAPASTAGLPPAMLDGPGPDGPLWRATGGEPAALAAADAVLAARPGQSLTDLGGYQSIEVWTECELSALHALWRLCRTHPNPARTARLRELRAWHLEHTQPDNGTNRPWAIHAFLAAGDPECRHCAETMLHAVCASDARGEPLTHWILADAANELALLAHADAPRTPGP